MMDDHVPSRREIGTRNDDGRPLVRSNSTGLFVERDPRRFWDVFALPLAAGVLAPVGIPLSPAIGAVFMSLRTVIVAINARRLRGVDLSVSSG